MATTIHLLLLPRLVPQLSFYMLMYLNTIINHYCRACNCSEVEEENRCQSNLNHHSVLHSHRMLKYKTAGNLTSMCWHAVRWSYTVKHTYNNTCFKDLTTNISISYLWLRLQRLTSRWCFPMPAPPRSHICHQHLNMIWLLIITTIMIMIASSEIMEVSNPRLLLSLVFVINIWTWSDHWS